MVSCCACERELDPSTDVAYYKRMGHIEAWGDTYCAECRPERLPVSEPVPCRVCGMLCTGTLEYARGAKHPVCSRVCHGYHLDNVIRRVAHEPRPCGRCGESFTPKRKDAVYCGGACRVAAHRARNGSPHTVLEA